jgi:4-hydroxybenzoate polyprenyltransferase
MVTQNSLNSEPTWLTIIRLLRWDKPAGRLILMIPALWAVFLAAEGKPPLLLVGVIILGSLATSAAGCVVNDLWDRDIDPLVERTKSRPLASKALSVKVGLVIGAIGFFCALILAIYLKPLSFALSVAAVPFIICYPLAKRVFPLPQLVLSLAWGFAVLISWTAVTGNLAIATWLLWGATVFWTLGFDTIYALSDREDDLKIGIKSSAIFFGKYVAEAVGVFFAITSVLMAYMGFKLGLNAIFWCALVLASIGWLWQYVRIKKPDLPRPIYNKIFSENVIIGFILLVGIAFNN